MTGDNVDPKDLFAGMEKYTIRTMVKIKDMFAPPFCRPVGVAQIGRMLKAGFDPRALGTIKLSLRSDGRYAVIDGMHRKTLVEHLGGEEMPADVYLDLTYEQEAALFEMFSTVKPPTALDRWRTRIERGEQSALAITHLLGTLGLHVDLNRKHTANGLSCVKALDMTYRQRGAVELHEILSILQRAWGSEPANYSGELVTGMAAFWARYRDHTDRERLNTQLQKTTPYRIKAAAGLFKTALDPTAVAVGRQISQVYTGNSKKYVLPEWPVRIRHEGSANEEESRGRMILGRNKEERDQRASMRDQVEDILNREDDDDEH